MASRRQEEGQALKTGSYVCFSVPLSWSSTECKNCSGPEAQGQSQAQAVLPRDLQATKRGHGSRSSIRFGWFNYSFILKTGSHDLPLNLSSLCPPYCVPPHTTGLFILSLGLCCKCSRGLGHGVSPCSFSKERAAARKMYKASYSGLRYDLGPTSTKHRVYGFPAICE